MLLSRSARFLQFGCGDIVKTILITAQSVAGSLPPGEKATLGQGESSAIKFKSA
jgi:hypothetical protein